MSLTTMHLKPEINQFDPQTGLAFCDNATQRYRHASGDVLTKIRCGECPFRVEGETKIRLRSGAYQRVTHDQCTEMVAQ